MFQFAEGSGCRHQRLVAYFGERLEPCGSSCDVCTAQDLVTDAKAALPAPVASGPLDSDLFTRLKALRREIAKERGVPAYLVFNDATLLEMVARRPQSEAQLAAVPGVGPKKLRSYGRAFLNVIADA